MNYIPVIVTYNRLNSLKKALEKLQNQTLNPYKIIVIDNHSTDGTENYMKEKFNASDQVKYYRLNENVGGSGGFSYGVKKALDFNPDWVALSDDDAFYDEKYFEIINKYIVKYPMIKCFCGEVLLDGGNTLQLSQRQNISDWITLRRKNVPEDLYKQDNFTCDTTTFVGNVISADLIKKIGLPRNDFFIWIDDIEYSCRMHNDTKLMVIPAAKVYHKDPLGTVKKKETKETEAKSALDRNILTDGFKTYYGFRNSIVLREKYSKHPRLSRIYTMLLLVLNEFLILTKSAYKGKRKYLLKMFRDAYHDGYKEVMGRNDNYLPGK